MLRPIILLALAHAYALSAQPYILLDNPSFEGEPTPGRPPVGWYFCGEPGESPPDIHPGGFFNVEKAPLDGRSYLGMVVRDNGTYEGVGQALSSALRAGSCYSLSLHAARSEHYRSISRRTGAPAAFTEPVCLLVWGGYHNCDRGQLLAHSSPVGHEAWKEYNFVFEAEAPYTHLLIEAFYAKKGEPYNGNVLVDRIGPLIAVSCEPPHLPTVALEQLETPGFGEEGQLTAYLKAQGQQVHFLPDTEQLEEHIFKDKSGRVYQANKHLWLIGRALRQFSGHRLLLVANGPTDFLTNVRLQEAYYSLMQAGLPHEQLVIRRRRRSDRRKEWLWPAEKEGVLMRLL